MKNTMCLKSLNYRLQTVALLALMMVFAFSLSSLAVMLAEDTGIKIVVNGERVNSDVQPFILDGRVMVPIRFVGEALGAEVSWDNERGEAAVALGNTLISIFPVYNKTFVNGKAVAADARVVLSEGRVFVPLRFIAENMKYSVEWEQSTHTVSIDYIPIPPLTKEMSLLEGRLYISMPQEAVQRSVSNSLGMPFDYEITDITSYGEYYFGIFAEEMFCYSTGDFAEDWRLFYWTDDMQDYDVTPFDLGGDIKSALFVPKEHHFEEPYINSSTTAGFLLVRMPDNTLTRIWILASENLFFDPYYDMFIEELVSSVRLGERHTILVPHQKRLTYADMTIDIAEGYRLKSQLNDETTSYYAVDYYIEKIDSVGLFPVIEGSYIGIFCGELQSRSHVNFYGERMPVTLLGQEIILWRLEYSDGTIVFETRLNTGEEHGNMVIGITIVAVDEADVPILLEMLESLAFDTDGSIGVK